jgi:hypothetical protein
VEEEGDDGLGLGGKGEAGGGSGEGSSIVGCGRRGRGHWEQKQTKEHFRDDEDDSLLFERRAQGNVRLEATRGLDLGG